MAGLLLILAIVPLAPDDVRPILGATANRQWLAAEDIP
jgi:hypothetical protein